jgi:SAM-dependent methyltransferase
MPATISTAEPLAPGIPALRRLLRRIKSGILRNEALYRLTLKWKYGADRVPTPPRDSKRKDLFPNGVLQSPAEWQEATRKGKELHLPLHRAQEKNWDHLAAVNAIVNATPASAYIFDAGAELYSNVLPALFVCGYSHLYGMNLAFTSEARRGPIRYLPGDITKTGFADAFFDAITCMSVIEHGVPLEPFFREMFRLLKPGGILITSTDYYSEPVDTKNQVAYDCLLKIFSRREAEEMIALARTCGFETTGEIDLESCGRPIRWEIYDVDYTFLIFTLRKPRQ